MSKKITDSKITQPQFDSMTAPLEQDLFAYFKVLEELIMSETFDDKRTPESLIEEITGFLSPQEETGSISIQKSKRFLTLKQIEENMLKIVHKQSIL